MLNCMQERCIAYKILPLHCKAASVLTSVLWIRIGPALASVLWSNIGIPGHCYWSPSLSVTHHPILHSTSYISRTPSSRILPSHCFSIVFLCCQAHCQICCPAKWQLSSSGQYWWATFHFPRDIKKVTFIIDIWNPFDRETGCSNLLTRTYLPGVVLIARAGSSRYRVCTHLPTLSLNIRDVKTFQHVKIIKL